MKEIENKINETTKKLIEYKKELNDLKYFFNEFIDNIIDEINQYIIFYKKMLICSKVSKNYELIKNIINLKPENMISKINKYFKENIKNKIKYLVDNYIINYKSEMKIWYKSQNYDSNNEIQLFGEKFVENNKNKCFYLEISGDKYDLSSHYRLSNFKRKFRNTLVNLISKDIIVNMSSMFDNCSSLEEIQDMSKWNTKFVKDMSKMLYNCSSLIKLPKILPWNTKNVEDMSKMFYNCSSLKELPYISHWDTKNVKDMNKMFYNCSSLISLPDISKWNTNNGY